MLQVVWNTFIKRMSFTVIWQLEIVFWKQHRPIQTKWISGYQILDFQSISMIIIKNTKHTGKSQLKNPSHPWQSETWIFKLFLSMQTDTKLPVKWLSPEVLETRLFTSYSDVWAFGILKWEMLTRCLAVPYGNINGWNGTFWNFFGRKWRFYFRFDDLSKRGQSSSKTTSLWRKTLPDHDAMLGSR